MTRALTVIAFVALAAGAPLLSRAPAASITPIDVPAGADAGMYSLASSADGTAYVSWLEPTKAGRAFRFAALAGEAWSTPRTITEGRDLFSNWADHPSIAVLGDGSLVAQWPVINPGEQRPGTYRVVATHVGLAPATLDATVAGAGAPVTLDLALGNVVTAESVSVTGIAPGASLDTPTRSASRLGLTARETPATLNVMTFTEAQARGLASTTEALARVPGVTAANLPSTFATSMRGFTAAAISTLYDGTRSTTSSMVMRNFFSWTFDRIEVLKGPASVLYGEGALAGAINFVTKRPDFARRRSEALVSGGSLGTGRAAFGTTGPIGNGQRAAYRADAVIGGGSGWVDDTDSSTLNLTGGIEIKLTPAATLSVSVDYFRDEYQTSYWGTPVVPGNFVDFDTTLTVLSLFAEDAFSIAPRVTVIGGGRFEQFDVDRRVTDFNAGTQVAFGKLFKPASGRVGVVVDVVDQTQLYAQVTSAVAPVSTVPIISLTNARFDLTTGRPWEFGVKSTLAGGAVEVTGSVFDLRQDDILTRDPVNPNITVQGGRQSSRGVETTVSLMPVSALRIDANGTFMRAQFDELIEAGGVDRGGNVPPNVPDRLVGVWATYRFDSLPLGAGIRSQGRFFANTANTARLSGYTVLDAQASWRTGPGEIVIRGKNLTNALYADWGVTANQILLGRPRTVEASYQFKF